MAGNTDFTTQALIRSQVWSELLYHVLLDDLLAMKLSRDLTDQFRDGTTLNVPSISLPIVRDYAEDSAIVYDALDTGNFQLTINEYITSGNYLSVKLMQDSYKSSELRAAYVPGQRRAILEKFETDLLNLAQSQTLANANLVNGVAHRLVGTGTGAGANAMSFVDFASAKFALDMAKVPSMDRIAIVHHSVEYTLNKTTNVVNLLNNPRFEGLIEKGFAENMRFSGHNIFGFDVYSSQRLALPSASETIGGTTVSGQVANVMMGCANPEVVPFVHAWRMMPKVDVKFNQDRQREEFVTSAMYGTGLIRPQGLVVVLTSVANA